MTTNDTAPVLQGLERRTARISELPDQDSNLDKQNQNLLCYRYTIGQVKAGGSVSNAFMRSQALITDRFLRCNECARK
jgi:hypothetical protein